MTIHIHEIQRCDHCGRIYLPFPENDYLCAGCNKYCIPLFNFTEKAAESISFNLSRWGTYTPAAWISLSFSDEILRIIFTIIQLFRDKKFSDFSVFAGDMILTLQLNSEDEYLRQHIKFAAVAVFERLKVGEQRRSYPGEEYL